MIHQHYPRIRPYLRHRKQDAEDDQDCDRVGPVQEEDQVVGDDVIAGEDLALDEVEAFEESHRHLEMPQD